MGLAGLVTASMPPGDVVTVYDVIGLPPFPGIPGTAAGALKYTYTCPLPFTGVPIIGANGTVAGVTAGDQADAGPVPGPFVAETLKL